MRLNADFDQRVVIRPGDVDWVRSPANGVERKMLDRVGDEIARATTIVRFQPGSYFPAHSHGGGDEYFVLEGTFSDESGDYTAGHYVRNPIGSRHTPFTKEGATIFVKLHQFDLDDQELKTVDTLKASFQPGTIDGLTYLPLHTRPNESVTLARLEPGTRFEPHQHVGGEEVLVLDGVLRDEFGDYPKGTRIRSPHLSEHTPFSDDGALLYVKTGHLMPDRSFEPIAA